MARIPADLKRAPLAPISFMNETLGSDPRIAIKLNAAFGLSSNGEGWGVGFGVRVGVGVRVRICSRMKYAQ